jgi:neutral trehalase
MFGYDEDGLPVRVYYVDPDDNHEEVVDNAEAWHPSEDIRSAWSLAEKMVQEDYDFYVDNNRSRESSGWDANYRSSLQSEWKTVSANKAPLAIVRAFLLAHGVTEVGDIQ